MCKEHHLIRMAGRIHRQLSSQRTVLPEWHAAATELLTRLRSMEQNWNAARQATTRGWHAAAALKDQEVAAEAARIEFAASNLVRQPMRPGIHSNPPTLRTIVAELQQLGDEFEDVEIDLKEGLIGVTTDRIVLEGMDLGPFSIDLHVSRLCERLGSECLDCNALEPNPASTNESVTHPHVQDGRLCAGDATLPVAAALKDGRIADAFVLIRSVLQTYNPASPYVSLENWSGSRCQDCDYLAGSDCMHFCEDCEREVCEDCYSSCDICDEGCCRNCLETDPVSDNRCCSACRNTCSECDRTVDDESFDQETDLCPACLEKHKQEQENDHELESEPVVGAGIVPVIGNPDTITTAPPIPGTAAA